MLPPDIDTLVWVAHVPSGEPVEDSLVGDAWFQGFLERWRRDGERWLAMVRYWTGPGFQHLTWVDQDHVRLVVLPPNGAPGEQ